MAITIYSFAPGGRRNGSLRTRTVITRATLPYAEDFDGEAARRIGCR